MTQIGGDDIFLSLSPSCTYSVGHNEVIGVCRVGNDADSLGRDHWGEMLTYPRKPVAHWHPLVEVRLFYWDPLHTVHRSATTLKLTAMTL